MRYYNDDYDPQRANLWTGSVTSALNSKRGQEFLKKLEAELLAMQERGDARLVRGYIHGDGAIIHTHKVDGWEEKSASGVCALGAACKVMNPGAFERWRNVMIDEGESDIIAKDLNIAFCLAMEVGVENDEINDSEECRFDRMLSWVQNRISRNGERVRR